MRTKTLLLTAAALLAAGIVSSQAQSPVYSQNIVGYASVPTLGSGATYYMMTVPFAIGVSNGANEIWPLVNGQPSLPDYSELLFWNGSGYTAYYSDSGSSTLWDDASFDQNVPAPEIPVGQGFFLIPSSNTTNVFAGTVAVNVGTSNSVVLSGSGATYFLVGSPVPYAGAVTNGNNSTGGANLSINGGLPDYSEILVWTGSGYTAYYSDSGSSTLWDDANFDQNVALPTISVGQGFFLIPSSPFTWKVGL
jgi:hypothetical protein